MFGQAASRQAGGCPTPGEAPGYNCCDSIHDPWRCRKVFGKSPLDKRKKPLPVLEAALGWVHEHFRRWPLKLEGPTSELHNSSGRCSASAIGC